MWGLSFVLLGKKWNYFFTTAAAKTEKVVKTFEIMLPFQCFVLNLISCVTPGVFCADFSFVLCWSYSSVFTAINVLFTPLFVPFRHRQRNYTAVDFNKVYKIKKKIQPPV